MKPPPFIYHVPQTEAEALSYLADYGDEASVLAGGQSLVPTMNFRLAHPTALIDLNRLPDLAFIRGTADRGVRLGAMTRQRAIERSDLIAARTPLLYEAMPYIAHPQIRNRGTVGGSLAHADPAAELPAVMLALDARFRLRHQHGERWVAAKDFYLSFFTTARRPEELLVEVDIPPMPPRSGWAFHELSRRHGDYALVGVAVVVTLDAHGRCERGRITLLSVADRPMAAHQATSLLQGEQPTEALIRTAAVTLAQKDIDPGGDIHASAAYRRHLAHVLTVRALSQAVARAQAGWPSS